MNVTRKQLCVIAGLLGLAVAGIGVWFWQTEAEFARTHRDHELADVLQRLGIAVTLAGLALVALAVAVGRRGDS